MLVSLPSPLCVSGEDEPLCAGSRAYLSLSRLEAETQFGSDLNKGLCLWATKIMKEETFSYLL